MGWWPNENTVFRDPVDVGIRMAEGVGVRARPDEERMHRKLDRLFSEAQRWASLWGLSRLMRDVEIGFSDELGGALGRCDLRSLQISLNGVLLLDENEELLRETLCHELAHVVASVRYGTRIAEHGEEWCEYMRHAGFAPRAVIPATMVKGL
jgi:hypothetical protein